MRVGVSCGTLVLVAGFISFGFTSANGTHSIEPESSNVKIMLGAGSDWTEITGGDCLIGKPACDKGRLADTNEIMAIRLARRMVVSRKATGFCMAALLSNNLGAVRCLN